MEIFIILLIALCLILIGFSIGQSVPNDWEYKQGHVDALNGKIKYEKKENEDGETIWVKK